MRTRPSRHRPTALHLALLAALLAACAPRACSDDDDRMAADVDRLLAGTDTVAAAAEQRLVAHGRAAIVILESGLYTADAAGRRRIVRTLGRLGDREAAPILEHLAARDPDPTVKDAAHAALTRLGVAPSQPTPPP
jgi:hypothetical protein